MRTNGTISKPLDLHPQSQFNEDGDPVTPEVEWSEPIPCFVRDVSQNLNASYGNGKFRDARYEILIEGNEFDADVVKVERNGFIGQLSVLGIFKTSLNRTKIVV